MQTENTKKLEEAGRKTWLLGLGAYDSALKTASGKFDQLYEEGNQVLAELISQGETLEAELKQKLQLPDVISSKLAQLKAVFIDDKSQELDNLSAKIDKLTTMVETLAEQKAKVQAKKPVSGTPSNTKVARAKKAPATKAKPQVKQAEAVMEVKPTRARRTPKATQE